MKIQLERTNTGSTILCALCTILIISLIGANVLLNCTTRYNVSAKQVKGWKEALYAAEGGGDIAFSVLHSRVPKFISAVPTTFPSSEGWHTSGSSYSNGPYTFGQKLADGTGSLSAQVTVDQLAATLGTPPSSWPYFRIRSTGTATLFGLPRVGMDDRMDNLTKADSLLRKIDFKYDHFKAKYGDGDGTAGTQAIQTVSNPQVTRRIETIVVPQFLTFTAALEATGSFYGPGTGNGGLIDSYDSKNGPYTFVANNSSAQYYADSRNGNVSVGTSVFQGGGNIYGNVTTNGGTLNLKKGLIYGTIDNNVPFTVAPLANPWSPTASGWDATSPATITFPTSSANSLATAAQYVYSSLTSGITISPYVDPSTGVAQETYVTIVVNGDVGGNITINNHVNAQIYFTGNLNINTPLVVNSNVDGVAPNVSRAGHLQFYGISPASGSTQAVSITPGGGSNKQLYATIYAPNANVTVNGPTDIYGALVTHDFYENGNTSFHYDKQIAQLLLAVTDYRIASYIEDVR
jgi:hypothetical protein